MSDSSPRYIVDEAGNRIAVVLDVETYIALLDAMEELEDIRAFDEAKAVNEETIPFEQAVAEIEKRDS